MTDSAAATAIEFDESSFEDARNAVRFSHHPRTIYDEYDQDDFGKYNSEWVINAQTGYAGFLDAVSSGDQSHWHSANVLRSEITNKYIHFSSATFFATKSQWTSIGILRGKTDKVYMDLSNIAVRTLPSPLPPGDDLQRRSVEKGVSFSNVTPSSIRSHWHDLRILPGDVLASLYVDAISAEFNDSRHGLLSEALGCFLLLWKHVAENAAHPELSISPKGYLVAEWYVDPDNSLVVMFNGNSQVFFSLFDHGRPCEGYEEGEEGIRNLVKMLISRTPNPFKWSDRDS